MIAPRSSCSGGDRTPLRGAADLRIITLSQRSDARWLAAQACSFPPTRGGCVPSAGQVNIVSFETSSARLVSSPPLLSSSGVVPAGPPKWLPPRPPLTLFPSADDPPGSEEPVGLGLQCFLRRLALVPVGSPRPISRLRCLSRSRTNRGARRDTRSHHAIICVAEGFLTALAGQLRQGWSRRASAAS